jgi:hypothetical protein
MSTVGYTMDTMYFSWRENPVEIDPAVQLPQFVYEDYILYDCSQNYTAGKGYHTYVILSAPRTDASAVQRDLQFRSLLHDRWQLLTRYLLGNISSF